ncbi:hypothetical protein D8B26_005905 [Coccidioides posadasii str. Silveira]|uniref:Thioesterase n=3 Tax=Coccidioides posadasii TaxID=199306 RepID=E9DIC7_COCPS|nr:thioesterase family protein [Coccidioides posadasii C735 delta SOWgp]EER27971.1 thioesterase family protein [Coccidioides posadasii C735 delta SOWgp]EFW13923.1 thioesterase [Coccidioides posadasii str. Silveira]KMM67966.1 thioesterase family protein [Coccidioides posadasii RMSCC 3488]QVM11251.1 hypothetical protein D8B26_005905 [Coccidioides posadasii str. Silveira]|eukprot:XP_003070116.1 thioesterase family protein [Coccidioides posadasii C735 delta SOWgp]
MTIFRSPYLVVRRGAASTLLITGHLAPLSVALAQQGPLFLRFTSQHIGPRSNRYYSSGQTLPSSPSPPSFKKRSIFRRLLGFSAIAVLSFVIGTTANSKLFSMHSTVTQILSDEAKSDPYKAEDEFAREVDEHINSHPLTQSMRENPLFKESRPHLQIPVEMRSHSLTGGTLTGPNKIVVPPYVWNEEGGKSMVSMFYLGADVSGHPGIVHGGLLATMLDEGLARCCFPSLPNKIGVTANLNIDYRRPAPAGSFFVLRAKTTKVEGRKAWVEGWIETLPDDGTDPTILVEAKALFVEPKNAAILPRLYRAE